MKQNRYSHSNRGMIGSNLVLTVIISVASGCLILLGLHYKESLFTILGITVSVGLVMRWPLFGVLIAIAVIPLKGLGVQEGIPLFNTVYRISLIATVAGMLPRIVLSPRKILEVRDFPVALAFVAGFIGWYVAYSGGDTQIANTRMVSFLGAILIYPCVKYLCISDEDKKELVQGIVIAVGLVSAFALFLFAMGMQSIIGLETGVKAPILIEGALEGDSARFAIAANANGFATLFVVTIFPTIILAISSEKTFLRIMYILFAFMMITVVLVTKSRSAVVAISFGSIYLMLALKVSKKILWGLGTILAIGTGIWFILGEKGLMDIGERVSTITDVSASGGRDVIYPRMLSLIADHPFGVGMGNVLETFEQYSASVVLSPHNTILAFGAESGWVGLIAGISLIIWHGLSGLIYFMRTRPPEELAVAIGVITGMCAFWVHGMFHSLSMDASIWTFHALSVMWIAKRNLYSMKAKQ